MTIIFVVEVGDVAIDCFILILGFEDVQLLHEELLLVFYLGEVRTQLGAVRISVLSYVLGRVVVVLLPVLCFTYAVAAAVILMKTHLAVVRVEARSRVA